jgi:hypothetical protein
MVQFPKNPAFVLVVESVQGVTLDSIRIADLIRFRLNALPSKTKKASYSADLINTPELEEMLNLPPNHGIFSGNATFNSAIAI